MTNPNIIFTAPNVAEVIDKPCEPGWGQILIRTARTCISSGTERANLIGDPMIGIMSGRRPRRLPPPGGL